MLSGILTSWHLEIIFGEKMNRSNNGEMPPMPRVVFALVFMNNTLETLMNTSNTLGNGRTGGLEQVSNFIFTVESVVRQMDPPPKPNGSSSCGKVDVIDPSVPIIPFAHISKTVLFLNQS